MATKKFRKGDNCRVKSPLLIATPGARKSYNDDLAMAEHVLTSNMPDEAKRRVLRSLIATA